MRELESLEIRRFCDIWLIVSRTSPLLNDPIDDFEILSRKLLLDIDPIRKFECRQRINTATNEEIERGEREREK